MPIAWESFVSVLSTRLETKGLRRSQVPFDDLDLVGETLKDKDFSIRPTTFSVATDQTLGQRLDAVRAFELLVYYNVKRKGYKPFAALQDQEAAAKVIEFDMPTGSGPWDCRVTAGEVTTDTPRGCQIAKLQFTAKYTLDDNYVPSSPTSYHYGYFQVQDEGVNKPRHGILNFVGSGVSIIDDSVNGTTKVRVASGSETFSGLTDVPNSYTGQGGKFVMVKTAEDGLKFAAVSNMTSLGGQLGSYYLDRTNHTGTQVAATISNLASTISLNTDVAANTAARHTHSNKTLLDGIDSNDIAGWDAAHSVQHSHGNKATLDGISAFTFLGLGDTPNSYSGQAGKVAVVNGTETALEFNTISVAGFMKVSDYDNAGSKAVNYARQTTDGIYTSTAADISNAVSLRHQHNGTYQFDTITNTDRSNWSVAYNKSHDQNTDLGTTSNTFSIGNGHAGNKSLLFNAGDANKPGIRLNDASNQVEVSHDGSVWAAIGTGTGETYKVKANSGDSTPGFLDAKVSASVVISGTSLALSGDSSSPGASKYYGTNGSSTKGFHDLPTDAASLDGYSIGYVLDRAHHSGSQLASTISNMSSTISINGDVSANTAARHTHSNKAVIDKLTYTKLDHWNDAYSISHQHSNKAVLDGIDATKVSNWDGAATNSHTHSNKAVIDGIDSNKVSAWDGAASASHSHGNKTVLDGIDATKVSNWDGAATNSHTHSNKTTLDSYTQTNSDLASAVGLKHSQNTDTGTSAVDWTLGTSGVGATRRITASSTGSPYLQYNGGTDRWEQKISSGSAVTIPIAVDTPTYADVTLTSMTGQVITSTAAKTSIQELDASIYAETNTGFGAWTSGSDANTYTLTGGKFQLDRAGYGWIAGKKITWLANQQTAALSTSACSFIYIDGTGTLKAATTSIDDAFFLGNIVLFEVLKDAAGNYLVCRENHPANFQAAINRYLHDAVGIVVEGVGGVVTRVSTGTGAAAGDREVKIVGTDILSDHGLETTISDTAGSPVTWDIFYTLNTGKWQRYSQAAELPREYNNAGTPAALSSGNRGVFTLYCTKDDIETSTPKYIAVMDSGNYNTLAAAQNAITAGTTARATNELAYLECAQLGYAIVRNTGSGYIETLTVAKSSYNSKIIGGGAIGDHSLLTGLSNDDHAQYALLAGRAGGQTLIGGTAASENLALQSTTHATKGSITTDSNIDMGAKSILFGASVGSSDISMRRIAASTVGIYSAGQANASHLFIEDTTAQGAGNGGGVTFAGIYTDAGADQYAAKIKAMKANSTSGNYDYDLAFFTMPNGGSLTERARLYATGGMNIGSGLTVGSTATLNGPVNVVYSTGTTNTQKNYWNTGNSVATTGVFTRSASIGLFWCADAGTLTDDGELKFVFAGTSATAHGHGWVYCGGQWAMFCFDDSGITLISNTANLVTTDTDGKACLLGYGYPNGAISIKNRLGSTLRVAYSVEYMVE